MVAEMAARGQPEFACGTTGAIAPLSGTEGSRAGGKSDASLISLTNHLIQDNAYYKYTEPITCHIPAFSPPYYSDILIQILRGDLRTPDPSVWCRADGGSEYTRSARNRLLGMTICHKALSISKVKSSTRVTPLQNRPLCKLAHHDVNHRTRPMSKSRLAETYRK